MKINATISTIDKFDKVAGALRKAAKWQNDDILAFAAVLRGCANDATFCPRSVHSKLLHEIADCIDPRSPGKRVLNSLKGDK